MLEDARRRIESSAVQTREAENARDSAQDEARIARRQQQEAERCVSTLEHKHAALSNTLDLERKDREGVTRRAEADASAFKEERAALHAERASLLRQGEALAELQQYSSETEELSRGFRDQYNQAQHSLADTERERDRLQAEVARLTQTTTTQAHDMQRRAHEHNTTLDTLRGEISLLESRLREATADSETKIHSDMQAMLSMQGAAMERDSVMVDLKEEALTLRDQLTTVTTEKNVLMQKLVKEREGSSSGRARRRESCTSHTSQHLLRSVNVQTSPNAAPNEARSSLPRIRSCSTMSASCGERQPTAFDLFPFHCAACGAPADLSVGVNALNCDPAAVAVLSLEGLKESVEKCTSDLTSLKALLEKKETAHHVLQSVLEKRLLAEIESLHACRAGRGSVSASLQASLPHDTSLPIQTPRGAQQTPSPPPNLPLPVEVSGRTTEDDLRSLRQKVSELKVFQRQMLGEGGGGGGGGGGVGGSVPVSPHQQTQPCVTPLTVRSASSSAIAMEAVPAGHDPRFLSTASTTFTAYSSRHFATPMSSESVYRN